MRERVCVYFIVFESDNKTGAGVARNGRTRVNVGRAEVYLRKKKIKKKQEQKPRALYFYYAYCGGT